MRTPVVSVYGKQADAKLSLEIQRVDKNKDAFQEAEQSWGAWHNTPTATEYGLNWGSWY